MSPSRAERPEDVKAQDIEVAEWAAGHTPAALHVPLGSLPQTQLATGRLVLAICRSGNRSATAAGVLVACGADARNVHGGLDAWQDVEPPISSDSKPLGAP